ncbi:MAG: L-2-hydroxyglutarate oxidase, partial [Porticoccaceae bacterium]
MPACDVIVLGGGIVGLSTAWRLRQRYPDLKIRLIEKESRLAFHQTGRNSGVLHSGIYYKPGSLRAVNCREGKKAMEAFCEEHGVTYELCGKVIVAV